MIDTLIDIIITPINRKKCSKHLSVKPNIKSNEVSAYLTSSMTSSRTISPQSIVNSRNHLLSRVYIPIGFMLKKTCLEFDISQFLRPIVCTLGWDLCVKSVIIAKTFLLLSFELFLSETNRKLFYFLIFKFQIRWPFLSTEQDFVPSIDGNYFLPEVTLHTNRSLFIWFKNWWEKVFSKDLRLWPLLKGLALYKPKEC